MSQSAPKFASLDDWIAREAMSFDLATPASFSAAVDKLIAALGNSVELLGLGEPLHGGEEFLLLRNRMFQHLVTAHDYRTMAVESSFPRGRRVNDYVAGRGHDSYDDVEESGFSHQFGKLDANRELIDWMRHYNAESPRTPLRFYGFDGPMEMMTTDSPRHVLQFVLGCLDEVGGPSNAERRERIAALLGADSAWENPAVAFEPAKGVGLSPPATSLRIETENLVTELQVRRPELVARGGADRHAEAVHYAVVARQLLNYHAALAGTSSNRIADLLGIRDASMADNLAYVAACERGRGKVLVFAHNSHLKYGRAEWQLGPNALAWWPAGAHLRTMFGPHYAVIGTGVGTSEANGIGPPEAGTLEARLTAAAGPARFIPAYGGAGLSSADVAALPTRSGGAKNSTYFAFTAQSLTDFDALAVLDSCTYVRGGPPLP